MRRTLVVLSVLLASTGATLNAQAPAAGAQSPPGEVRGKVVDVEASKPIATASIEVRSKADSSLVTGAVVREDGTFRIQGLRPGAYYLRVRSIGYGPMTTAVTIAPAAPLVNVGDIGLSRVAVALEGMEVTAERPAMVIEPDRNSYTAKDVAPAAANVSDVLDAVPSVQVDGEGKVSLRGNENVAVQINGRPAPIRGAQLGAYLRQLPASIVERVEVVPTPSARYDPEGMAGIINIVLKQNTDLGLSGGLTLSSATASGRYNAAGNVGYQAGPWTSFTSIGYNADDRGLSGINDRERYDANSALLSVTAQDIAGSNGNSGFNFNTTVDYKLNKRDVLSNVLSLNSRRSSDDSRAAYRILDGDRSFVESYDRLRDSRVRALNLDYNLAFKRTLEARRHELSSELRFTRTEDDDRTQLWRTPSADPSTSATEREIDDTDALTQQLIAQLDYVRPFGQRTKLESGYKGTARWLDRDYQVQKDEQGTGEWVRSALSNAFDFDEQVHAVYGVLSQGVGKFDLQAGLRGEYASRDFTLASSAQHYPYSYTSFFPSGVVLFKPNLANEMKVSYSRRIRRPGTQELNPFVTFFDQQNVFIGNPQLKPEYTDAIELGYTRTFALGTVQLSPFYRRTTDIIRVNINTADVIDGREVTSVSFENLATSNSWGTDLNGSLRLGPRFSGFASFNVFKQVTDGGSESSLTSNAVTWSTRFNVTAQVTKTLTAQGAWFYRAPVNIERARFSGQQMANFSLRQRVMNDKAAVTLRVVDPFNAMVFKLRTGDDNITQITERRFGVRAAFLSFQYNFGRPPRVRQPRPDEQPQSQTGFPPG
jgi:outer membrane receptor protein involved in Fe transport